MTDAAIDTTPAPEAGTPGTPAAPAARIAEIENIMRSNIDRYEKEGMSDELLALRRAEVEAAEGDGAEQVEDDLADANAIDLSDDANAEGEASTDEPEAQKVDLQWDREDFEFTAPEGTEVTETGRQRIDAFADFAHTNNMAPEIFEASITFYNDLAKQERTRLDVVNKTTKAETVAALKAEHGANYKTFREEIDGTFAGLSKETRQALQSAQLPDGRKLLSTIDGIRLVHQLGRQAPTNQPPQDPRTAMQEEIAAIDALMAKDVGELYKPWRNTGMSASDRRLQLAREMDAPTPRPSAKALQEEERALLDLYERDRPIFEYSPTWRGTNQTAAARLYAIRAGRA